MSFRHKHIIALRDLSKDDIELLLDTAESMREINSREIKKVPTLRGKTIINLFYGPESAGDEARYHRHAPCCFGESLLPRRKGQLFDYQCRRWRPRTPIPGTP